jgi:acyl-lipid omega-6 desaturase (Delta-12 desaturase)
MKPIPQEPLPSMKELNQILAPYQKASMGHSLAQLANTLIPYMILWVLMFFSLKISYLLTLALAIPAALFMVRLFIFFHDCGHNSFFPSKRANKVVGAWLGVLVFTPGEQWWHSHAIHHATSGNLDKRGTGDITTLTMEEYLEAKWFKRFGYRFIRNPLVMFGLGPLFMFLVAHRLPLPNFGRKQTMSVVWNNLAVLAMAAGLSLLMGFKQYLLIQIPVMYIAGAVGIWLFYIQHQFEEDYWERDPEWNYVASALLGASFYKLPGLLQWFSGNIGYHHIHHLSPRVPNYYLDKAHASSPLIQKWARQLDLRESFRTIRLKVWDEPVHNMRGFPARLRSRMRQQQRQSGD